MILDSTKKLQVVLAGAITTNQLPVDAAWVDMTATTTTPGSTQSVTNSTTDVDIVAAPAAGTQRVIQSLSIYNKDTVNATVTVKIDVSTTDTEKVKVLLQPGQSLVYTPGSGWQVPQGSLAAGNKASFRAHKNGTDQTGISTGVVTKITFTTEVTDIGSYYDAPNSKWTPPAGPVLVGGQVFWSAGVVSGGLGTCRIYKNGAEFCSGFTTAQGAGDAIIPRSLIEDIANGTDYYEIYGDSNGAGSKTASGATQYTAFFGTSL